MMPGLIELVIVIPLLLMIGTVVCSIILRIAIGLFNRLSGANRGEATPVVPESRPAESLNVDSVSNDSNPYASPVDYLPRIPSGSSGRGVPAPGFGKAVGITLLFLIFGTVASWILMFGLEQAGVMSSFAMLFQNVIHFFILAGLLTRQLPTTFGKACLVSLLFSLITFGIAIAVGIVVAFAIVIF